MDRGPKRPNELRSGGLTRPFGFVRVGPRGNFGWLDTQRAQRAAYVRAVLVGVVEDLRQKDARGNRECRSAISVTNADRVHIPSAVEELNQGRIGQSCALFEGDDVDLGVVSPGMVGPSAG